jgi:hypothetical protein
MKMPVNRMLRMTRRNAGIEGLTPPVIGGVGEVGEVLDTVTDATWSEAVTVTYQWYRGADPIIGATSESYTVVEADAGETLRRRDTGTAGAVSASQVSNTIAIAEIPRLWTPLDLEEALEAWWSTDDLPATVGAALWPLTYMANGQTWTDRSANAYVATLSVSGGATASALTVCDGFTGAGAAGVGKTVFTRNNAGGAPTNGGSKGGFLLPNELLVGAPAPGAFTLLKSAMNATTLEIYICGGVYGNIGTSGNSDLYHWQGGAGTEVDSDLGRTVRDGFVHGSTLGTPHILGIVSATGERSYYMDGAVAHTSASNTVAVAGSNKRLGWSRESGVNFQFDGWFGDVVFTRELLSLSDRQKLEGWYAARYALQSLLDVAHPYKVDPPMVP